MKARRSLGRGIRLSLLFGLVLAGGFAQAALHPFHVTFATAEWNAKTKRLEVALRIDPNDLEQAIERREKKEIALEDNQAEQAVESYLRATFLVKSPQGKPVELGWVGYEVEVKRAWLYFEIPLEDGPEGIEIKNTMLFGQVSKQVNIVSLRAGKQGATLKLTSDKPSQRVRLKAVKEKESDEKHGSEHHAH